MEQKSSRSNDHIFQIRTKLQQTILYQKYKISYKFYWKLIKSLESCKYNNKQCQLSPSMHSISIISVHVKISTNSKNIMAWWQYAIQKCKITEWKYIDKSIKYTCLLFCIVSGQWRFTLLSNFKGNRQKSVSSGLDFFTLNKGFTNVTNQERHPKQMKRQSKKSNLNSY